MKKIGYVLMLIVLTSCNYTEKKPNVDIKMSVSNLELYLIDKNNEGRRPPILFLNFEISNYTNLKRVFIAKGSSYDKLKSRLIMIDTLNNKVIPLYSYDTEIIRPNKVVHVTASIELDEIKSYLNLSESYFNKKNYLNDRELLMNLCVKMLKNSKITYIQNSKEANKQKIFDKDIVALDSLEVINVIIPQTLNFSVD